MTESNPDTRRRTPPTHRQERRPWGTLAMGAFTLFGLTCAGLFFGIFLPNFQSLPYRAKSAEAAVNVAAIRQAELDWIRRKGSPLAAGPAPVPVTDLAKFQRDWTPGTAFDSLGWAPEGQVRGTYEVRVTDDGFDFVVHGWLDADGDGVPVHFTATRDTEAVRLTPKSVL